MSYDFSNIYIFSTDTVNGIGGKVSDLDTLEKLYYLKKRPLEKKIMILVGSLEQAQKFPQWTNKATTIALKYWPGPYSIIVNNQGFRMPNNAQLCEFLIKNGPMYTTSLNISGSDPIQLKDASNFFPEVKNILDFGQPKGIPSTIINLDTNEIIKR
ncbi:Sua5/YciO/YrdC/YwlC family protein [Mycoplasmopsis sturni]|uniref:Sua5/YciO/YrdC/YwlC family protein n=1 Tax=Mycoplasmopsis sturni TaxID=39047 RepID=UPI0005634C92|nr:Sua5/YciO/YrdC/YwlC family protein [Mycoplasmopsis sturni]